MHGLNVNVVVFKEGFADTKTNKKRAGTLSDKTNKTHVKKMEERRTRYYSDLTKPP